MSRKLSKTSVALQAISAVVFFVLSRTSQGELISVDLQTAMSPAAINAVGVEARAAAADPLFTQADVWNHPSIPTNLQSPITDPSFSTLLDSTGSATSVGFSITGNVGSWSFSHGADPILADFFFLALPGNLWVRFCHE